MVDVAQLVRAPGCGPGGRGFESHLSPHYFKLHTKHFFEITPHNFILYWAVAKW